MLSFLPSFLSLRPPSRPRLWLVLCGVCGALHGPAQAQTAQPAPVGLTAPVPGLPQPQSPVELLRWLTRQHPLIQAKKADADAARQAVEIARRQHWPTPSLGSDYGPKSAGHSNPLQSITIARVSVPLFTGGLLSAEDELAAMRLRSAELDVRVQAQDLGMQLLDLYRNWWQHTHRLETLQQSLARMQDLQDMMQRRNEAGISAPLDLQLTQVQLRRLQDEQLQSERLRDQALGEMVQLLGRPVQPAKWRFADLGRPPWPELGGLTERVLQVNPAMQLGEQQIEITRVDQKRTRASLLPTVSLRYEHQWGSYYGSTLPGERL